MAQNSSLVSVAILGATGMVGQRFVQMLENHPQLKVVALGTFTPGYQLNLFDYLCL